MDEDHRQEGLSRRMMYMMVVMMVMMMVMMTTMVITVHQCMDKEDS